MEEICGRRISRFFYRKSRTIHITQKTKTIVIYGSLRKRRNNVIPFLGTLTTKKSDGSLNFTVYRKPAHTENHLKCDSTYLLYHKKTVARSLVDRSFGICSTQDLLH